LTHPLLLPNSFLYAGYQDTLANGIGGTLQRPSFNELIGVRVGDFSVPAALPVFYLIFVYFAHWLLPLVFKSKDAYPRLAGATDAYNIYSVCFASENARVRPTPSRPNS
jgi:hypothetical protein